jgi:Helix-turn-helix domain
MKLKTPRKGKAQGTTPRGVFRHKIISANQVSPYNGGPADTCTPHDLRRDKETVGEGGVRDGPSPFGRPRQVADVAAGSRDQPSRRDNYIRGPPPLNTALAYRVNDAAAIAGLGRSTIYGAIKTGALASVLVAGRRLIPAAALRQFLQLEDA